MDIDLIFKVAGIGLIVAVLNQILSRTDKGEYALITTLTGIIIVLLLIIPELKELLDNIKDFADF